MKKSLIATAVLVGCVVAASAVVAAEDGIKRTADGKPDFTGVYDISSITPFARPKQFGDKLTLTVEEAQANAKSRADRNAAQDAPSASASERAAPEKGGNVGAYNNFWFEWGSQNYMIDGKYRTSVLVDPPNGQMPAMTEEGKARAAAAPKFAWPNKGYAWWLETGDIPYDGPETNIVGVRCLYQPTASVAIRPLPYNNVKTIVQTEDHFMIMIEWMHWTRVVRIGGEHMPAEYTSLSGDSIGWWEGDTLVVETTNFRDMPDLRGEGVRVIERFSPNDGNSLLYSFTVENPEYEAPYSGELPWAKTTGKSYEYACHEGNYAAGNTLRGARLLEAEYEKGQASSGQE
ncbi:MAG: hypothetical protein OXG74_20395 [Acidobacteria bacterium]|nr:hypothetical protein [Acidobacteriota bacterium]